MKLLSPILAARDAVLDFLIPPTCLSCEQPIAQHQALCPTCWAQLHFIAPPLCARCGLPFDLPVEEGTLCGLCLDSRSPLVRTRAAVVYDEASKPIILRYKHGDRLHPTPAMAGWMIRAGSDLLAQADVLAPVPLHRWRLLRRRYNQSALLAMEIAAQTGIAYAPDLLLRYRATPSQGQKNRKERALNVRGAFTVHEDYDVTGKNIVLIDDVMTTGATLEECARMLAQAGAAQITALTFARPRRAD